MSTLEIFSEVFKDVIGDNAIEIHRELTAESVPAWDSLSHVRLIVALESKFDIEIPPSKISSFENVGDLLDYLESQS